MSVGAGSIRRAAKAAAKPEEAKLTEAVKTEAAEGAKEASKGKTAVKAKPAVKKTEKADVAKQEKRYGIGEELPVHLM